MSAVCPAPSPDPRLNGSPAAGANRDRLREAEERILEWAEENAGDLHSQIADAVNTISEFASPEAPLASSLAESLQTLRELIHLVRERRAEKAVRCAQRGIALRAFLLVLAATCAMGTVIWCMSHSLLAAVAMALAYGAGVAWLWRRGELRGSGGEL